MSKNPAPFTPWNAYWKGYQNGNLAAVYGERHKMPPTCRTLSWAYDAGYHDSYNYKPINPDYLIGGKYDTQGLLL